MDREEERIRRESDPLVILIPVCAETLVYELFGFSVEAWGLVASWAIMFLEVSGATLRLPRVRYPAGRVDTTDSPVNPPPPREEGPCVTPVSYDKTSPDSWRGECKRWWEKR